MKRPWRCRIGRHRWINMRGNAGGLWYDDRRVERICSRCGLPRYAAQ